MSGFQRKVRTTLRTPEEIATEQFAESPVGLLIAAIKEYAEGRNSDIAHGAETPALASLMVQKYGHGLMKAAAVLGVADSRLLTDEVDRLVAEIDPQNRKHQQYHWESMTIEFALALLVGIAGGFGWKSYHDTQSFRVSQNEAEQLRVEANSAAFSSLSGHDIRVFKIDRRDASATASVAVDGQSLCWIYLKKDQRAGKWQATAMQCRKAKNKAELQSGWTASVVASSAAKN